MAYPRLRLMTAVFTLLLALPVAGQMQSKLAGTWTLVDGVRELGGKQEPIPAIEQGRVYLVVKPDGSVFQTRALRHSFLDDLRNKGDKYVTSQTTLEVTGSAYEADRTELIIAHESGYRFTVEANLLSDGRVAYRSTVPSYGGADLVTMATLQRVEGDRPWEDQENLIATWKVADGTPSDVDVSADGKYVVAADRVGRKAYLWDVAQGRMLRTFNGHTNDVSAVAISADGEYVASGSRAGQDRASDDHSLTIWNASTGQQVQRITAFSTVNSLEFLTDGKSLLAAGRPAGDRAKSTAGVWNVESGTRQSDFLSSGTVKSARCLPDGQSVVCLRNPIGNVPPIGVYDRATGNHIKEVGSKVASVDVVAVSPDGSRLMTCSQEPVIREWDITTGHEIRNIPVDEIWARQIAYLPDGRRLMTANESDHALHLWDLATGKHLAELSGHRDSIRDMEVSADGRIAVTCSDDGTVKVWRIPS